MARGSISLSLMLPLAITSTNAAQRHLGKAWRSLHLLSLPALILGGLHTIVTGSTYLGSLQWQGRPLVYSGFVGAMVLLVLAVRSPSVWQWCGARKWYTPNSLADALKAQNPSRHL